MTALQVLKPLLQQRYAKKKGRPAKSRPIFVSRKIELQYTKELLAISEMCQKAASEIIIPDVAKNIGDSWFSESIAKFKQKVGNAVDAIANKLAHKTVNEQKKQSDKQLADQLEKLTGLDLKFLFSEEDLAKVVDEAISANVSLIRSIPQQYADRVESIILNGLQGGRRSEDIAKEIGALGQTTDDRARLIAQDQLGKINSRIAQIRQQKLGVTHYTWSTSHDERVRHSHRLRDGVMFAWDNPPSDGHPGQPIRCRCVALPYLEHLLDESAPTAEQMMIKQKARIDNIAAAADHVKASEQLLKSKKASKGLKSTDLLSLNNGVGQGNKALRESIALSGRLRDKLGATPPVWAVNNYSIHSKYINDLLRGRIVSDEFKDSSLSAISLLDDLFSNSKAVVNKPFNVFRGDALSDHELATISNALKDGLPVTLSDKAFLSTSLDPKLAQTFSERNAKNDRKKVIFSLKLQQGVQAIDISPYHFYTGDNEILLNRGSKWRITGMKQREDGIYEVEADVLADKNPTKLGDSKQEKTIIQHDGGHDDDPRWDRWCADFTITIG